MKILVSVLLLISLNAMAAQTKSLPLKMAKASSSNETTFATPANQTMVTSSFSAKPWALKKLSVGVILSQADTFKGATYTDGFEKLDADINSSTAMGFVAQLTDAAKWNKVGWYAALNVEQTRELSSVKLEGNNVSIPQKPSFRPWIASGGANYEFNQHVYAFGGLNYTLYTEKDAGFFNDFEMAPQLGYQYGVGGKIQKVNVELSMREVAYDMSLRKSHLKVEGRSTLAGLNIQARYNF